MALGKGKHRLSIVLTEEQVIWIRAFSKEADMSVSQVVRAAVKHLMLSTNFTVPEPDDDPFTEHDRAIAVRRLGDIDAYKG